ncbi:putative bifunctional diguanylate cyclase/phosphodiesterase [Cryptosporangium phraense]|uniref:EAL domain-containing protein n=1 Tax=Cryptosporangium phraense TaxID=2593070 RepID=A0A545AHT9_9ACTN|nr:bifunctional diguanylate cyclase/phosphodiesterase [Cryptosporangium phraense]TQS40830.1 EAL domain-containing protein [Cryptosporangium phraense]
MPTVRHALRELIEPAGLAVLISVVNALGWYGGHSTPVLLAVTAPVLLMSTTSVQLLLSGGDLTRRIPLRMFLHLVVCFTPAAFVTGWGPVMMIGVVVAAALHMRWSGAGVWRIAVVYAFLVAGLGLGALASGLVTDYFGRPNSFVLCGLMLLVNVLVLRSYGEVLEHLEHAEAEMVASRAAARRSESWFRAIVQNTSDVISVIDSARLVTYVSEAVEQQLGHRPADILGGPADAIVDPADRAAFAAFLDEVVRLPVGDHRAELRLWYADGTQRWHEATAHDLLDDSEIAGIVLHYRDVHERRAYHDLLAFDASHDSLTGLANRAELNRALDEALLLRAASKAAAAGEPVPAVAVLLIDLDGFKPVNDTYGHEVGDALLVSVARLLERNVLGVDTVARLGGDEFVVLLSGIADEQGAIAVAERVLGLLRAPLRLPSAEVRIGASIGIALASEETLHGVELLRLADHAMYQAKRQGRHRWVCHRPGGEYVEEPSEADIAASNAAALERDLRVALTTGRGLSVVYQPIVLLEDRSLWGFEALVRWTHPTRGPMSPAEFVPVAERTGVIHELGRWVLDTACRQVALWQQWVPEDQRLSLSVNLSARDLDQPGITDVVLQTMTAAGLDAENLVIEVTESALVDPELAIPALGRLSAAGIRIAIDDFGTGYSSLQYLTQMPVDILKLDRSFVSRLNGTPQYAAIAEAVVRLSQTLRFSTVAEGVETEAQAAELAALGYRKGQGYLFSKPLTADEIGGFLQVEGRELRREIPW